VRKYETIITLFSSIVFVIYVLRSRCFRGNKMDYLDFDILQFKSWFFLILQRTEITDLSDLESYTKDLVIDYYDN